MAKRRRAKDSGRLRGGVAGMWAGSPSWPAAEITRSLDARRRWFNLRLICQDLPTSSFVPRQPAKGSTYTFGVEGYSNTT